MKCKPTFPRLLISLGFILLIAASANCADVSIVVPEALSEDAGIKLAVSK